VIRRWLAAAATPEDRAAARAAVFAATVVACAGLATTAGAELTSVLCVAATAAGHWVSWRGRHRPRRRAGQVLLGGLLLACIGYLVLDLVFAAFGGALPQAKFALLALAVTSFDLKSRRNLFSHVWHSATILYVGALFAWDFLYVTWVVLWALCFFAFMLFSRAEAPVRSAAGMPALVRRSGRRAAPWIVVWLVVGGLTFVGLPRFAGKPLAVPLLVSIPLNEKASGEVIPAVLPLVGTTPEGDSDGVINLRVRGRLGEEVVFRVRAPAASYWRAYVLETYDGQSWVRVPHPARLIPPISQDLPIRDEHTETGPGLPQTFYIQRPLPTDLLVSYPARDLYFPAQELTLVDTGTIHSPYGLRKGVNYSAVSQVRDLSPAALRAAGPLPGTADRVDLDVSQTVPPRVQELSDRLAAGQPTEYDKVRAITVYLRDNYRYSLDTPRLPPGKDAVDQFLFVDRVGFCEQFASVLAVMLRQQGIPSRLAVGYSTGDIDTLTGTFTVRARDAHAWVEVYFPRVGWVPFDASPGFDSNPIAHQPPRWFLSDFSPQVALSSLGPGGVQNIGLGFAAVALVVLAYLGWRRYTSPVPAHLRNYRWAQRYLAWARLPARDPTETPAEHMAVLARAAPGVAFALAPLARSVEDFAFRGDAAPPPRAYPVALAAARHMLGGRRRQAAHGTAR
jgi:transglutaminase-like putative cysteine protease